MKIKPFLPFIVTTVISGYLADKLSAGSGGTFSLQTGRLIGGEVILRLMCIDRGNQEDGPRITSKSTAGCELLITDDPTR